MSVLLVSPPIESAPARICTPPLGLAYLSASLKKQGIKTWLLDADALGMTPAQVAEHARSLAPKIIGVTSMTPTAPAAYRILELLRPLDSYLVLGGPHVSALGKKIFDDCPVRIDAAVCGEAENTFPPLVEKILSAAPSPAEEIPGVLTPTTGDELSAWPRVEHLDDLPLPDRDALPDAKYRHPLFGGEQVTTMITSRGCPYRCIFCDKHTCGSRWRARSAAGVLSEVSAIIDRGIRNIMIYDDLFTLDRERVIEICRGIIEGGHKIRWKCEGRVNRVDAEMLSWMKRAGCEMIAYGVETANRQGLDFLRKDITVEQVGEAFALTRKVGIQTLGYFLLGIPGETMDDEMKTVKLAIEIKADYAQFGVLSPFPGTPLYDYAAERGWVHEHRARGPAEIGGRRAVILDGYWSLERLDEMVKLAHRNFYFRPSYIMGRLAKLRFADEAWSGAAQGMKLLKWWLEKAAGRK